MPEQRSLSKELGLIRRILRLAKPPVSSVVLLSVLHVAGRAGALLTPWLIGLTFQEAILADDKPAGERFHMLLWLQSASIGAVAVAALIEYLRSVRSESVMQCMVRNLKVILFERLLRAGKNFYDTSSVGVLVSRLTYDAEQVPRMLQSGTGALVFRPLGILVLLGILVAHHPWLALASLVPLVFGSVLAWWSSRRSSAVSAEMMEHTERHRAQAGETLSAVSVVQIHNQELAERERFEESEDRRQSAASRMHRWTAAFSPVGALCAAASHFIAFLYGGTLVVQGELKGGMLVSFIGYLMALSASLVGFGQTGQMWRWLVLCAQHLLEIYDQAKNMPELPSARPLERPPTTLEFRNVRFGYAADDILHGISFRAAAGDRIGIKGPSGSGKSTLASLLVRFYDVREGSIELDGLDLRQIRLSSLRDAVTLVPQEDILFSGTARENVLYGNPSGNLERAVEACQAGEFIGVKIGERGRSLSAGQRQRLSLARALMRRPSILILDESTNNLDVEMEQAVLAAISAELPDSILIVISHRPSALAACNRILEMEAGRLSEGTVLDLPSAGLGE